MHAATRKNLKQWLVTTGLAMLVSTAMPVLAHEHEHEHPTTYSVKSIAFPNDVFTQLLGINNNKVIAGYHGDGQTPQTPNKGFTLVLPNKFMNKNFPNSAQTQVVGIDNRGNTGGFYVDTAGVTHGFLKSEGKYLRVDAPDTQFNQILGRNDRGQAAGYSSTDPTGQTLQRAFIRQRTGSFTYLTVPAGTLNSQATGINYSRAVSGFYQTATATYGFLLQGNKFKTLSFPGATVTQALGLNNMGQVVGFYTDASDAMHGFIYHEGN